LIVVFASAFACEISANMAKAKNSFFNDFIIFPFIVLFNYYLFKKT
jgi:hypothetical protein